jgi:hypothetical protein
MIDPKRPGNTEDISGKSSAMKFETMPSDETQNNLIVRISYQWNWYIESAFYISLTPTVPIRLYECKIIKGD